MLDTALEDTSRCCDMSVTEKQANDGNCPSMGIPPSSPWERVHADFAEIGGQSYLIMVDAYSKWIEVQEMGSNTTASKTIEVMRRIFSYHGLPQRLVTDSGPQFRSSEFQDFMKVNGIKHQLTPPYHPSSNGQAERMVKVFKKSMEGRPAGISIQHQISLLLLRYRTTANTTTWGLLIASLYYTPFP